MKKLNVFGELGAELKVEFILSALLGGTCGHETIRRGVAQNGRAKLFVHENARFLLRHTGAAGGFEAVVDHLFGGCNFGGLLRREIAVPAEHFCNERASMIEGQDVERLIKSESFHGI